MPYCTVLNLRRSIYLRAPRELSVALTSAGSSLREHRSTGRKASHVKISARYFISDPPSDRLINQTDESYFHPYAIYTGIMFESGIQISVFVYLKTDNVKFLTASSRSCSRFTEY